MATEKQIEANRLNALKSTGPRTEEGKRVSSQNALKSGLDAESQFVSGESPADFAQLQAEYFEQFAPANAEQRFHVDKLIRSEWLLRRYHRVEAQLWQYQARLCEDAKGLELGVAFSKAGATFQRLHRRMVAVDKAYNEALAALKSLQQPAQAPATKDEPSLLASFLNSGNDALADFAITQMNAAITKLYPNPDPLNGPQTNAANLATS